jgi:hypothetical protein
MEKILNKVKAWKAGKPVKMSVPRETGERGRMIGKGEEPYFIHEEWGKYQRFGPLLGRNK